MQLRAHEPNHLQRLPSRFTTFTLPHLRATRLQRRIRGFGRAHVALRVHLREVDAVDADEGDVVHGEADDRRLDQRAPFLTAPHQVHDLAGRFEAFSRAVFPECGWYVVLFWRKEGRVQRSFWLGASDWDEGDVFAVEHDLAEQIDGVDECIRCRALHGDVCLCVLEGEGVLARQAGFEVQALLAKLEELAAIIPWRMLLSSALRY